MREFLPQLNEWIKQNNNFAIATVIETWGSAPRGTGSTMAIREDMQVLGSVSGGCVESAVIEEALSAMKAGNFRRLSFDVSNESAWSVGLTCGGRLVVLVEPRSVIAQDVWDGMCQGLYRDEPFVLLSSLDEQDDRRHLLVFPNGCTRGNWGDLSAAAVKTALECYRTRTSQTLQIAGKDIFFHVFGRRDRLVVVGGNHIAVHLLVYAAQLCLSTTLIEPRKVFSSSQRFLTSPQRILTQWPDKAMKSIDLDEDTYAVLLSHDPKLDDPALHVLLQSPVAYIGALGSRKTHASRCARLEQAGFTPEQIARIHGPAGIDIHAKTPAEIALSIVAQVIARKNRVCRKRKNEMLQEVT